MIILIIIYIISIIGAILTIRYDSYFNKQLEHKELQTSGGSFNWLNQAF